MHEKWHNMTKSIFCIFQAYKRQANSVKIAKITAFTIIISSFILGSFILASSYLQAKASCDQVQALDSVLEKELMLETLQQVGKVSYYICIYRNWYTNLYNLYNPLCLNDPSLWQFSIVFVLWASKLYSWVIMVRIVWLHTPQIGVNSQKKAEKILSQIKYNYRKM